MHNYPTYWTCTHITFDWIVSFRQPINGYYLGSLDPFNHAIVSINATISIKPIMNKTQKNNFIVLEFFVVVVTAILPRSARKKQRIKQNMQHYCTYQINQPYTIFINMYNINDIYHCLIAFNLYTCGINVRCISYNNLLPQNCASINDIIQFDKIMFMPILSFEDSYPMLIYNN